MTGFNPFIATAFALQSHGIRVFPVQWQSKSPLLKADWRDIATTDTERLARMVSGASRFNLAMALGPSSGIIDLELDSEQAAKEYEQIASLLGDPVTISYKSSRGTHRLFRWDERIGGGKAVVKYRGIELRIGTGDKGAYSVCPPSTHASGANYQWMPGCSPWEASISPLPEGMINFFREVRSAGAASRVEMTRDGDDFVPEPGQRHAAALRITTLLAGHIRLPRELVTDMMMPYQEHVGKVSEFGYEAARKEIHDMVSTVQRPTLPDDILVEVDFDEIYEAARVLARDVRQQAAAVYDKPMPPVFSEWVERLGCTARLAQVPKTFILMNALTAVSAALGASVTVQSDEESSPTGVQIYSLGVGESGSGKSRAMKTILSTLSNSTSFITNTTPEALMSLLARTPRGVCLKIVEGKQLTRMMGKYSGESGTDNTVLLEAWSGDTISVNRQDAKRCTRISDPFLTIAATVQPHNLRSAFGVDDIMEGLMQRLLIYSGDGVPEDADQEASREFADLMCRFNEMMLRLHNHRSDFGNTLIGSVAGVDARRLTGPLRLVLDEEGRKLWQRYAKYKRSADTQDLYPEEHPFRTDMVRHAEYVLRIAGCLFMMDIASSEDSWEGTSVESHEYAILPCSYVSRAASLMEWLWSQKQVLMADVVEEAFHKAKPEQHLRSMQTLPEAVRRFAVRRERVLRSRLKGKSVWTVREYQRHLRIDTAQLAREEIALLESMGHVYQHAVSNRSQVYKFSKMEGEPGRTARQ